ncbi:MAG TPA: hypothetical protein VI791_03210 [Patescibacteria group bacterium]|nr:hypothetical protein [Patescibacteria group bacterium]
MDERQGTAIGDTKEDNLEIDEVVEGGRLTWGGVIVADIKEELLGNHAIAEIVSKSMVGQPEDEKSKAEMKTLRLIAKYVGDLERDPGMYTGIDPNSNTGYLYTCAADILRMAGKRVGVSAALDAELRGKIRESMAGFGKRKVGLENKAEYELTDDEAAVAYVRYLEGLEPEPKGPSEAQRAFFEEVNKVIPETVEVNLADKWVVLGPGVGRDSKSVDVVSCREFLEKNGVRVLAVDWPPFKGDLASFVAQADWLRNVLQKKGIDPENMIYYGHSKGDLVGREFADKYGVHTYIGSCGPARSESDMFPTVIRNFLEATKKGGNLLEVASRFFPEVAKLLKSIGIGSEFHHWLLENFDEAASIYLGHIKAGRRWDELARRFPRHMQSFFYFGDQDGVVDKVGHGSTELVENAITIENPVSGHKMIPNEMLLRLVRYAVIRRKELEEKFDPKRLT